MRRGGFRFEQGALDDDGDGKGDRHPERFVPAPRPTARLGTAPQVLRPIEAPGFWRAHGAKLLAFGALALVCGVLAVYPPKSLLQDLFGRGYVRWQSVRWRAIQYAKKFNAPLVVHRVDPRHADNDAFRARVLTDPGVQAITGRALWYREELTPAEADRLQADAGQSGPRPPELVILRDDGLTPLCEPLDPRELTPAAFLTLLRRCIAENQVPL